MGIKIPVVEAKLDDLIEVPEAKLLVVKAIVDVIKADETAGEIEVTRSPVPVDFCKQDVSFPTHSNASLKHQRLTKTAEVVGATTFFTQVPAR